MAEVVPRARARDPYLKPRLASAGPLPCPRSRPPGPHRSGPPLGVSSPGFGGGGGGDGGGGGGGGEGPRAAPPLPGAPALRAAPGWS